MSTDYVERPARTLLSDSFSAGVRATLTNGKALRVPLNGEPYEVVRNRKVATAGNIAKKIGASSRTMKSDDGLALLIWLEPKNGAGKAPRPVAVDPVGRTGQEGSTRD